MDQSRTCQDVISSPPSVAALMYPTSSVDAKKKTECVEPSFRIRMHPVSYVRKYVRPSGSTHLAPVYPYRAWVQGSLLPAILVAISGPSHGCEPRRGRQHNAPAAANREMPLIVP